MIVPEQILGYLIGDLAPDSFPSEMFDKIFEKYECNGSQSLVTSVYYILHSFHGKPAVIWHNGDREWWKNGKRFFRAYKDELPSDFKITREQFEISNYKDAYLS